MLEILSVEAGKGANVAVHTHSLFVRHVRLVPFHAVGEGNVDVRMNGKSTAGRAGWKR